MKAVRVEGRRGGDDSGKINFDRLRQVNRVSRSHGPLLTQVSIWYNYLYSEGRHGQSAGRTATRQTGSLAVRALTWTLTIIYQVRWER